jgi:hypothetical protein
MSSEALPDNQKRFVADKPAIIKSIFLILIICCILISPFRNLSFNSHSLTQIDETSIEYLDQTLKRATIAYGLCRATNALVSVLQEIEIGFEVFGTITLSPFEWLDPLNDLVERFSWVLLAAMASIGIQEFFIRLLPDSIINFILLPGLFMWLTGLWVNKYLPINLLSLGKHLVLLTVILRFIIPAEVAINNWIYDVHLEKKYNQSVDNIKISVKEIKDRTPVEEISFEDSKEKQIRNEDDSMQFDMPPNPADSAEEKESDTNGFFNRTKDKLSESFANTKKTLDLVGNLNSSLKDFQPWLKTEVPILFENFISLIMVFIISTMFLPIFILWLIVYLIRLITNSKFGHTVEKQFKLKIFQKRQKGLS